MSKETKETKVLLKQARGTIGTKEYDECLRICERVLQANPESYAACLFGGAAAEGLLHVSEAVQYFKKAITIDPVKLDAYKGVVRLLDGKQLPDRDFLEHLPPVQKDLLIQSHTKIALDQQQQSDTSKWYVTLVKLSTLRRGHEDVVAMWRAFMDNLGPTDGGALESEVDVRLNSSLQYCEYLEEYLIAVVAGDGDGDAKSLYAELQDLYRRTLAQGVDDETRHEIEQKLLLQLRTRYIRSTAASDYLAALQFACDVWEALSLVLRTSTDNTGHAVFVLENICELLEEDAHVPYSIEQKYVIIGACSSTLAEIDPKHGLSNLYLATAQAEGPDTAERSLVPDYDIKLLSEGVDRYPHYVTGWVLLVLRLTRARNHQRALELARQGANYLLSGGKKARRQGRDAALYFAQSERVAVLGGRWNELRTCTARVLLAMGDSHTEEAMHMLEGVVSDLSARAGGAEGCDGSVEGLLHSEVGAHVQLARCATLRALWDRAVSHLERALSLCTKVCAESTSAHANPDASMLWRLARASVESELGWVWQFQQDYCKAVGHYAHAMGLYKTALDGLKTGDTPTLPSANTDTKEPAQNIRVTQLLTNLYGLCEGRLGMALLDMSDTDFGDSSMQSDAVASVLVTGQDKSAACSRHLLQAAKLTAAKPYADIYTYLGNYYLGLGPSTHARGVKCYAKATSVALSAYPFEAPPYSEAIWGSMLSYSSSFGLAQTVQLAKTLSDLYLSERRLVDAYNLHVRLTTVSVTGSVEDEMLRHRVPWAWFRSGIYCSSTGQYQQAIEYFQTGLRAEKNNVEAWENLGECYLHLGQFVAAQKALTKAVSSYEELQLECPEQAALCCISYCRARLGEVYRILSFFPEAFAAYADSLRDDPMNPSGLLGLAQTYLSYAFTLWGESRGGAAVAEATKGLSLLLDAHHCAGLAMHMSYWKMVGDLCMFFHISSASSESVFSTTLCPLVEIAETLFQAFHSDAATGVKAMLGLAAYSYQRAGEVVEAGEGATSGEGVLLRARLEGDLAVVLGLLKRFEEAISAATRAVTVDQTIPHSWRVLGYLCADSKKQSNAALGQHAFVIALQLQPQHAPTWTNLGLLYLAYDNFKLALKCFSRAQTCDPAFAPAWAGQAFIATSLGDHVGIELYHHSAEMDEPVPEGLLGFAQNTYHDFKKRAAPNQSISQFYLAQTLDARPVELLKVAMLSLERSTVKFPTDEWAWNTLGVIRELLGLNIGAKAALSTSLDLLLSSADAVTQPARVSMVASNLARALCSTQQYEQALDVYAKYTPGTADLFCALGMGRAYYQTGRMSDAHQAYTAALAIANDKGDTATASDIQIAIGLTAYASGDIAACKSAVFASLHLAPHSANSIATLGALGLLQSDLQLVGAALDEEKKLPFDKRHNSNIAYDFSLIRSCWWLLQGDSTRACRALTRNVHDHGAYSPEAWGMAATYIRRSLKSHPSLPMAMYKNAWDVMRVSSYPATDVAELLSVYSSALTLSGTTPGPQSIHVAHRKAQAAVFRDPTSLNAWAALAGGLLHTALSSACVDTLREDSSVRHGYTVKLNLALHLCDYVRVRSKDMEADLIARSANAPAVQIRTQAAQLIATTRWASLAMCECLLLLGEAETSPTSHTEDKDTPTDAKEPNAYLDMAMGLAVESLNGYQADDTGRVVWLHLLARLHAIRCKTGDVELAIRHLRTAISASVEPSALWLSLGDLLSSVGKTQGSRLCMQQAAAAAESVGLGSTMQLVSLIRLTWLNLLTGHTTEAEESLRQASDLDAHAVPLTFFKGVLSVMKKDNRQARRAFTKLLSTSETQSDWHGLAISLNDMYGKQA